VASLDPNESVDSRLINAERVMLGAAVLAVALYLVELRATSRGHTIGGLATVVLLLDLLFVIDLGVKSAWLRGRYLMSPWFLIDFFSTVPVLANFWEVAGFLYAFRILRGLRVLRTLRALRLVQSMLPIRWDYVDEDALPQRQAFERTLSIVVVGYALIFLLLAYAIHGGVDDPSQYAARAGQELNLALGSVLGMAIMLAVIRALVPEISARQMQALLNIALPEQVARHFLAHPEAYGDTTRMPASVIFCDLVGFTACVEKLGDDLDTLQKHLEAAMSEVVEVHRRYDLIVDKFLGDAVMSFRGGNLVPGDPSDHALRVVQAALDTQAALNALGDPFFTAVKVGGASSGGALIGTFGTSHRLAYTILGDRVNLAARLEAACGQCGTRNLFCEWTYDMVGKRVDITWRRFGNLRVHGKGEITPAYEAFRPAEVGEWLEEFNAGLEAFEARRFEEAQRLFEAADAKREGGDKPSQKYASWAALLAEQPPRPDWTPVFLPHK